MVAAAIVAVVVGGFFPIGPAPTAGGQSADLQNYIGKINALRASVGVPPLQLDPQLTGLSQEWAEYMASTEQLVHPPDIEGPVSQPWILVGDNMALGSTLELTWQALLDSPVHYQNLTDPRFTHIGIGVAYTANGRVQYTHQWFKQVPDEVAPPPEEPEPEAPPVEETTTIPPETVPEPEVGVLPQVQLRAVNVAVIPPIEYGRPALVDPLTGESSSSNIPLLLLLAALAILLLLAAALALRSRQRRMT
jgi:hypothetical protein